jgi:hypothetical protein
MKPKSDDAKNFDRIFENYEREALERLRKSGDRLPGFSLFFVGIFAVLGAVCISLFQIGFWFKEGHWLALPFSDLLLKVGVSIEDIAQAVEWKGIAIMITWIGDLSIAFIAFFVGMMLILFGRD